VPAPDRAGSSASRGAVWVAASISTIFTIVDLQSLLVKIQKAPQSLRSSTKPLFSGWVPQLRICTLRDVLVSSLPLGDLGDLYLLDLPFDLPLNFLSSHW